MQLTTPVALDNGRRLLISKVDVDDDAGTIVITWQLRTGVAASPPDAVIAQRQQVVRNGLSDVIRTIPQPFSGMFLDSLLYVQRDALATPAGFTNALNAWRAGATPGARRSALEAHGQTAGWIHSTLAGS